MNYPLISEYIEAIKAAEDNFEQLKNLRPVLDDNGQPVMSSGNFAVVFKMKDEQTGKLHAVKCFLKEQEGRAEAYRLIAEELEFVSSTFLTPIKYLDKELYVDTSNSDENEFPVLLMDWVEGQTLDKYIREHIDDEYELSLLAYQFSRLAMWLMPQPFAHGDLKPDNILVREDGTLVLVDYDGMYVPAMKGQKARELGSPDFRHPSRIEADFDEHIDDFSLISILLSLKAIALQPELLEQYGSADRLLFSEKDYRDISQCQLLKEIFPSTDSELNILQTLFTLSLEKGNLADVSFRLLNLSRPKEPEYENLSTEVTEEDLANAWTDEFGVMYSKDRLKLLGVRSGRIENYEIREGTRVICDDSLNGLWAEIDGLGISGTITIPSTVQSIGRNPFCGDYENIICKSPYFVIENKALYTYNKKRLISCFGNFFEFVIPEGVVEIGGFAFYGCSIFRIVLPSSISVIDENPFIEMELKYLNIICNSLDYYVQDKAIYKRNPQTLISYFGFSSILFVDNNTISINPFAFWYTNLNRLYLPKSIQKIPVEAFYGVSFETLFVPKGTTDRFSSLLKDIEIHIFDINFIISEVWYDDSGAMYSEDASILLKVPNDLSKYVINKSTDIIGDFAFAGCSKLQSIIIPDTVTKIGEYAFLNCSFLRQIIIPDTVTIISDYTFLNCTSIQSIQISNSVKAIGEHAFDNCNSLKDIVIPDSVCKIGRGAFQDCWNLDYIKIPDSLSKLEEAIFLRCTSLKQIDIPISITKIEESAFQGCQSLSIINIPEKVNYIGKYAFLGCASLGSISIPSVEYIGDYAFKGCNNLKSIYIPYGTKDRFEELLPIYKDKLVEEGRDVNDIITDNSISSQILEQFGKATGKSIKTTSHLLFLQHIMNDSFFAFKHYDETSENPSYMWAEKKFYLGDYSKIAYAVPFLYLKSLAKENVSKFNETIDMLNNEFMINIDSIDSSNIVQHIIQNGFWKFNPNFDINNNMRVLTMFYIDSTCLVRFICLFGDNIEMKDLLPNQNNRVLIPSVSQSINEIANEMVDNFRKGKIVVQ